MNTELTLNWSESLATQLPEVDSQHKRLIELINRLGELHAHKCTTKSILAVLEELRLYTVYHFSAEEELMRQYPVSAAHYAMHVKAHKGFIDRLENASELVSTSPDDVVDHLLAFLVKWLVLHITGVDVRMAHEIISMQSGLQPEKILAEENAFNNSLIDTVSELYDSIGKRTFEMLEMNRKLETEIARRIQIEKALRMSEARYRSLYQYAPLAMWEEDWSEVKVRLNELGDSGVTDVAAHLNENPAELKKLARSIRIRGANQAAMVQAGAISQEKIPSSRLKLSDESALHGLVDEMLALEEGNGPYEYQRSLVRIDGNVLPVISSSFVMAGHNETMDVVIISTQGS